MNETGIDHRLVREYLRALDNATASLPGPQARELREQITAHLDEALPPGATDDDVRAELRRLGTPRALAAEAAEPRSASRRLLMRLSRLRWWVWTLVGAPAAALVTVIVFLNLMESAQPLDQGGLSAWWFDQDGNRGVHTSVGTTAIWAAPERYRQEQGFVVGIYNDSGWTQTILGGDPNWAVGDWPAQFAVASSRYFEQTGQWNDQTGWDLPASIPPHSYRLLRVLWVSYMCTQPGDENIITDLLLRVRVGLITRTEDVQLHTTAFALSGTKASAAPCRM